MRSRSSRWWLLIVVVAVIVAQVLWLQSVRDRRAPQDNEPGDNAATQTAPGASATPEERKRGR